MRDGAGRGGRGAVGRAWGESRWAAAAQSGAGQHGAEVGEKREGEEVRWGGCDALSGLWLCRSTPPGGLDFLFSKWVLCFTCFRSVVESIA